MHDRALRVALTGGAGAGKSALGDLLASLGAVRIDADVVAREVVVPGSPGLAAVVARFGAGIVTSQGQLDRASLAAIVFDDDEARLALNAILHPLITQRSRDLMAAVAPDRVVVYEVPLLAETGRQGDFDVVVVVEAAPAVRRVRLAARGLDPDQIDARLRAQASEADRRAIADHVIVNDTTREHLDAAGRVLWHQLTAARQAR